MTPFFADDHLTLYAGDCLDVMPLLADGSIDAVVTDPPYGIGFMGHAWDGASITSRASARASQQTPGVRPDTGRQYSSAIGSSPAFHAGEYDHTRRGHLAFQAFSEEWGREAFRVARAGAWLLTFGSPRSHHRLAVGLEDAGWELRDELAWLFAQGMPKGRTTLKPAHEPILLARKPAPRAAHLQIEETRVPFASIADEHESKGKNQHTSYANPGSNRDSYSGNMPPRIDYAAPGRWPANVLLTDWVLDPGAPGVVFSRHTNGKRHLDEGSYSRYFLIPKANRREREAGLEDLDEQPILWSSGTKSPGTFQSAGTKRSARNHHPTIKPAELMEHLVKLVTPPGGIVLDPFLGSGTTALAAIASGRRCIGIEREAKYLPLVPRRLRLLRVGSIEPVTA